MSDARDDERLAEVMEELGPEAIGVYWIILEIIADKMDGSDLCSAQFPIKKWKEKCGVSTGKFTKIAQKLAEKPTGFGPKVDKKPLVYLKIVGEKMMIKCPNLLKFRDEHTSRLSRKSVANPEQELELELELELEGEPETEPPDNNYSIDEVTYLESTFGTDRAFGVVDRGFSFSFVKHIIEKTKKRPGVEDWRAYAYKVLMGVTDGQAQEFTEDDGLDWLDKIAKEFAERGRDE